MIIKIMIINIMIKIKIKSNKNPNHLDEDLGKYSCKAKNSLGSTDGEITLYGEIFFHLKVDFGLVIYT